MSTTVALAPSVHADRALVPLFTATLFISAGLMFLVEPMVARMVLPRLGGAPTVWSTCLVFFQAALLLGYAYAHTLTRWLPRRGQILFHLCLVLPLAAFSLPLSIGTAVPVPGGSPALWLLARLAVSAGPVVFAISATAPLLQTWFASLAHEAADDPYFLYAGSNAGSLLALLAYPLLVEPALKLNRQAELWSWGFAVLAAGIALSAAAAVMRGRPEQTLQRHATPLIGRWRERITWTVLALVPSSLLLGVTTHITSDIASAPLLWVFPLALYLLTFVLAFARRPPLPHAIMVRALPLVLIPVVITMAPGMQAKPVCLLLHVACLFVAAMVCHGELARRRPGAAHLTEFYFFLSVGGVLGGAFNALLAPVIFPGVWEYPIALVAVCLIKPRTAEDARPDLVLDFVLPAALFALVVLARRWLPGGGEGEHIPLPLALAGFVIPGFALLNFSPRRLRLAAGVAACILASTFAVTSNTVQTARSFFGVYRVRAVDQAGAHYMVMMHGTTLHGVESQAPGETTLPMGYYSHEGPFGRFFAALPAGRTPHVAVIGLGAGALACYARPGEKWTFYEIDPLVERLARDTRYFHYLADCGDHPAVLLGDARLTLAAAPDAGYDVLVLDAFSSDSIPMHLITREALALYVRKLAPGGRILFHISSRMLDLRGVLGALAADAGLTARLGFDTAPPASVWRHTPALVVELARAPGDLGDADAAHGWVSLPAGDARSLWTDQQSDLLHVIRFGG